MKLSATFTAIGALASTALAADSPSPTIYKDSSSKYSYLGCYNETTGIADSTGERALSHGISEVKPGEMTVPMCLSLCGDGSTKYLYAGLEFARECWCSNTLSGISTKFEDSQCNLACDGNKTMTCGGALKLTVYKTSAASPSVQPASMLLAVAGVAMACLLL